MTSPHATLVVPLIVGGVGASMAIPVVQNTVLGGVAPDALGKASGVNNTTQELGGAFGVAILVAAFTTVGSYASSTTFITGFTAAIGACAGLAVAAMIAAWFVPGPGHTGDPHATGSGSHPADAAT